MSTVDELAKSEQYRVWFVVNYPSNGHRVKVRDLADAFIVLQSIEFHVLSIPEDIIDRSVGGIEVFDDDFGDFVTWHEPNNDMDWEWIDDSVVELMDRDHVSEVDRYHYPVVKQYINRVLSGETF